MINRAAAVFVGRDGAIGALMWSEVTNGGLIGHGRGEEKQESPKRARVRSGLDMGEGSRDKKVQKKQECKVNWMWESEEGTRKSKRSRSVKWIGHGRG